MAGRKLHTGPIALCAMLSMVLAGCASGKIPPPSPVTEFTASEEAESGRRYDLLLKSFSQGGLATIYEPMVPVAGRSSVALPKSQGSALTISEERLRQAEQWAGERNSSALIVYRGGAIELESYFGSNDAETLLNSKSFAKPLTAIAVGRAIALGKIESLDQPVADFIPAWRGDPVRSQIAIRHLLDMRSGFLPQAYAAEPAHILNRAYLHPRHDEVIVREYPLTSAPGTRYDYSNANAEMIAPLIKAATGSEYEEFLAREVLQPIGAAGGQVWLNREGGTAQSGCCIMLPARDWLRLSILLLHDGVWEDTRLLLSGYVGEMRTGTPENPRYGLGLWLPGEFIAERPIANPDLGQATTWHSAPYIAQDLFLWDGNGNQVSYIIPSQNMVILRMGNAPARELLWDNAYLPNLLTAAPPLTP